MIKVGILIGLMEKKLFFQMDKKALFQTLHM